MTTTARIQRKAASWSVTILTDPASTIAFEATWLAINNANGKFRLTASCPDGSHVAAMVDIVIGPEHPAKYADIYMRAVE